MNWKRRSTINFWPSSPDCAFLFTASPRICSREETKPSRFIVFSTIYSFKWLNCPKFSESDFERPIEPVRVHYKQFFSMCQAFYLFCNTFIKESHLSIVIIDKHTSRFDKLIIWWDKRVVFINLCIVFISILWLHGINFLAKGVERDLESFCLLFVVFYRFLEAFIDTSTLKKLFS